MTPTADDAVSVSPVTGEVMRGLEFIRCMSHPQQHPLIDAAIDRLIVLDGADAEAKRLQNELSMLTLGFDAIRRERDELRSDLTEARRVIDEARNQEPTAWRPKFDIEGDWSLGEPSIESIEYWHEQGVEIEYAYLRAAPVPAQPSAVPEAVAKVPVDPDVETLKRMHEAYWGSSTSNYWHENSEPLWRKTYAAILSAADTEGRSNG